jgi:hypothetical protein
MTSEPKRTGWIWSWFELPIVWLETWMAMLRPRPRQDDELTRQELERLQHSVWRLRRAFHALSEHRFAEQLLVLIHDLFGDSEGLIRWLLAWSELIEVLVEGAEVRYGTRPGRGKRKAQQVKGDLLYVAKRLRLEVQGVPPALLPVVLDVIIDPLVAMIVELLNRHQLWSPAPRRVGLGRRMAGAVGGAVPALIRAVGIRLAQVSWWFVLALNPPDRKTREAIDLLVARYPRELTDPTRKLALIAAFIGTHGKDVAAVIEIVSVAVVNAEEYLEADGPRKKVYARELVLAFLADIVDLPPRGSASFQVLSWFVDFGIELVVRLLNKKERLRPHGSGAAPQLLPPAA